MEILYFSFYPSENRVNSFPDHTKLPNIITVTYSMIRTMRKPKPSSLDPGSNELYFVGSPNKYLRDPDLVINQDTKRVAAVDNVNITGNDPKQINTANIDKKRKIYYILHLFCINLLRYGIHEAAEAMLTSIC